MNKKRPTCILLLCIFKVLPYTRANTDQLQATIYDINIKKYLTSENGFNLNEEQMKKHMIWENGMVPYYIDTFSYDKPLRDEIRTKLYEISDVTGVTFVELAAPPADQQTTRWVMFLNRINKHECDEHKVTPTGIQRIILGYDCLAKGSAVPKAALAILNIPPQHNSPDRDEFIEVHFDKILSGKESLFQKLNDQDWIFHDVPYDFKSVGHYNYFQYTKNGYATISPQNYSRLNGRVGDATSLSESDVWKIVMLYNYIIFKAKKPSAFCNKIFVPGVNYSKIEPEQALISNRANPRDLPNKYLGLPDNQPAMPNQIYDDEPNIKQRVVDVDGNEVVELGDEEEISEIVSQKTLNENGTQPDGLKASYDQYYLGP